MVNKNHVVEYLNSLKNNIFKILPLYEENNKYIISYIQSLKFEIENIDDILSAKFNGEWYIKTIGVLNGLLKECNNKDNLSFVKKEIFSLLKVLDSEIKNLKE